MLFTGVTLFHEFILNIVEKGPIHLTLKYFEQVFSFLDHSEGRKLNTKVSLLLFVNH